VIATVFTPTPQTVQPKGVSDSGWNNQNGKEVGELSREFLQARCSSLVSYEYVAVLIGNGPQQKE